MGRSATNVVGNAVAAGVIAKWEQARTDVAEQSSALGADDGATLAREAAVAATQLSLLMFVRREKRLGRSGRNPLDAPRPRREGCMTS